MNNRKLTVPNYVMIVTTDNHSYAFRMASRDSKQKVCANYPGLLIDTGATSHIVRDAEKFVSFNDNFNPDEHTIELEMARNHMQPNREVQQK